MKAKSRKQAGGARAGTPAEPAQLTRRDRLEAELRAAIGQIDEQGLVFLLEQANVLLHNARVEELERRRKDSGEDEAGGSAAREKKGPIAAIEESADRKTFFMTLGKERKVLSLKEMQQIVRICHDAPSLEDASRRLYTVFSRERRDILVDGGSSGVGSPVLGALVAAVRERYRPRAG